LTGVSVFRGKATALEMANGFFDIKMDNKYMIQSLRACEEMARKLCPEIFEEFGSAHVEGPRKRAGRRARQRTHSSKSSQMGSVSQCGSSPASSKFSFISSTDVASALGRLTK